MKGRMRQQPEHENRHEARVIRAVEAAGVSDEERERYLVFARELDLTLRRSPKTGTVRRAGQESPEFRNQKPECRIPGYTPEPIKRVVQKWFERGLSGHKMWLIGEALMRTGLG